MAKKLKGKETSSGPVAIEHPELGGSFFIDPMKFDQATHYARIVTREEFEYDLKGKMVFHSADAGQLAGTPVKKYAGNPVEHVDFAVSLIDRIEDLDYEMTICGVTFSVEAVCRESSPRAAELVEKHLAIVRAAGTDEAAKAKASDVLAAYSRAIRFVLTLMGTSDVEFEVDVDAEGKELTPSSDPSAKVGAKNVVRPVNENVFLWVTRESAKLAKQRNEVAKGN